MQEDGGEVAGPVVVSNAAAARAAAAAAGGAGRAAAQQQQQAHQEEKDDASAVAGDTVTAENADAAGGAAADLKELDPTSPEGVWCAREPHFSSWPPRGDDELRRLRVAVVMMPKCHRWDSKGVGG